MRANTGITGTRIMPEAVNHETGYPKNEAIVVYFRQCIDSFRELADYGAKVGVKITIDGSPQGRTARFTTPYLTGGPGGQKNWQGELTFPQETINQIRRNPKMTVADLRRIWALRSFSIS